MRMAESGKPETAEEGLAPRSTKTEVEVVSSQGGAGRSTGDSNRERKRSSNFKDLSCGPGRWLRAFGTSRDT